MASLDSRVFCREHFVSECYSCLERCALVLGNSSARETQGEAAQRLLSECARHATDLATTHGELTNLERAQLLDIVLCAADLSRLRPRNAHD